MFSMTVWTMFINILTSLRPAIQTVLATKNQEMALTPTVCMQIGCKFLHLVLVTGPAVDLNMRRTYMQRWFGIQAASGKMG